MNAQAQRHRDTQTHDVIAGHVRVAHAGEILVATGIGSCVVIVLYDPGRGIGAMAHPMLPRASGDMRHASCVVRHASGDMRHATCAKTQRTTHDAARTTHDCMYVDEAIDWMVAQLEAASAACTDLEARLVGGADMFAQGLAADAERSGIGLANVREAHACLARRAIPVLEQCTGGTSGRSVHFHVGTRVLVVREL